MGASDPQLISVYRTAVAVFQNSQKNCSPTQASAAIFLGSCAIFLGSHGTHSWSPSRERKLIITTRFEERRTISLPGSSSMRLCRFFGIKENPSFEQRGGGGKGGGGVGSFLNLPIRMSQRIQNHPIIIITVKSQAISSLTQARRTSGKSHRARAGLSPGGWKASNKGRRGRRASCFHFLALPLLGRGFWFLFSIASDKNLRSNVRRSPGCVQVPGAQGHSWWSAVAECPQRCHS